MKRLPVVSAKGVLQKGLRLGMDSLTEAFYQKRFYSKYPNFTETHYCNHLSGHGIHSNRALWHPLETLEYILRHQENLWNCICSQHFLSLGIKKSHGLTSGE